MARHILAIDLGTSALKVALVSTAGEVVASEQDTCQVRLLPGGGAEQDPAAVVGPDHQGVVAADGAAPPSQPESVVAVACTAQWSGTVPVDERCQPLRDAIIWMDSRGAPYVRRITHGPVNVQGYGVDKLARWLRTTGRDPRAERQGLHRPHPVAQARRAGDLPPGAPVPGAQGLAERPAHRAAGGIVRLDRAALGDRQPPSGPDPVRPGAAAAGRDRAVAPAGAAGRHRHPRPAAARARGRARRPGRHPGRGRLARPPVGGDRGRGHPGLPGAPVRRHLLLADLPRAVQADRPAAQHGLAALADPGSGTSSPTSRRPPVPP